MDISNAVQVGAPTSSGAKTSGAVSASKSVASGSALPAQGQLRVRSDNRQDANPVSQSTEAPPASQPNAEELQNLVEQANVSLQGRFSDLKFTVAEGTDINVVRVEDSETGEVIRQFPSEAMVAIARAIDEAQQGMMLEEKA